MKTTFMTVRLYTPRTVGLLCLYLSWSKRLAAGRVTEITAVRRFTLQSLVCSHVLSLQADVTDVTPQIPNVRRHVDLLRPLLPYVTE